LSSPTTVYAVMTFLWQYKQLILQRYNAETRVYNLNISRSLLFSIILLPDLYRPAVSEYLVPYLVTKGENS